ncbi:MAG: hypothetical protein HWE20_02790 [Gammaproteobacteria bacterium]|nr:hypothetical protein [Gammaproteobacteria bacterium]
MYYSLDRTIKRLITHFEIPRNLKGSIGFDLPANLDDPKFRLNESQFFALIDHIVISRMDGMIEVLKQESWMFSCPPITAAFASSQRLNQALNRLDLFKSFSSPFRLQISHQMGTVVNLRSNSGIDIPHTVQIMELLMISLLAQTFTQRPFSGHLTLDERLQNDPIALALSAQIQAHPRFGDQSTLFISAEMANLHIHPQMSARFVVKRVNESGKLSERVIDLLMRHLPAGNGSQQFVAEKLFMSKRSLQRKLALEGVSFSELLASARKYMADIYLTDPSIREHELSFLLGYGDPRSYRRASREWN